ncbi:DUF7344 domain-containing protein [Haloarcula nitratireducens]|uniref:DUF7344 domain-containing protein n=1 Tax=Haloarcula nitratireducens TaxID=2487749 RepID=A0AAW4P818_9EURY|nr:hypothetical protein [Halomicroarcula nitratireducens]MBX0294039.1 hypothetical protein [Halomicroarcula nitratireducens]
MSPEDDESPLRDGDSETGLLPDADAIELLASRRRRTLLGLLVDADGAVTLGSLATAIAQTERASGLGATPSHRIAVSLHHAHLPKLDAAGVVDYDRETNSVRYRGDERIETWLAAIDES